MTNTMTVLRGLAKYRYMPPHQDYQVPPSTAKQRQVPPSTRATRVVDLRDNCLNDYKRHAAIYIYIYIYILVHNLSLSPSLSLFIYK